MWRHRLIQQPRLLKQLMALLADAAMGVLAVWLAFSLRLDGPHLPSGAQWWAYALAPLLAAPVFLAAGLYRTVFRFAGMVAMRAIVLSVLAYGVLYFGLLLTLQLPDVPRSVGLIQPLLLLLLLAGLRALVRRALDVSRLQGLRLSGVRRRVLIYGAGSAGRQMAGAFASALEFEAVGFLDDSTSLKGLSINGLKVYAPEQLPALIERLHVSDVVLAMPSASRARRNEILSALAPLPVHVRSLPGLSELAQGKVALADLKELDVEDLLGRPPVAPQPSLLARNISAAVVLVTGAGGSIGSELCRQILAEKPRVLVLLEHSEFALYAIHAELITTARRLGLAVQVEALLADVRDARRMKEVFDHWRPNTVYHAAAYKHVPLVEHNVAEGVANNTLGTRCVALAAMACGVQHVVLISTDKAVRPTNVMGASKRMAELVLQALAARGDHSTVFCMVRFGNVLGSSGSVVPLFRRQIRSGGPITLTHPDVTRYFMTIPEAAQLVLQAGGMAKGGEVFVLDMGKPVRIGELAERMVRLSGLTVRNTDNPQGDIAIEITGLRPGEKLYEELLIGDDPQPTQHPRIWQAREDFLPWVELEPVLGHLQEQAEKGDEAALRQTLARHVSGFVSGFVSSPPSAA